MGVLSFQPPPPPVTEHNTPFDMMWSYSCVVNQCVCVTEGVERERQREGVLQWVKVAGVHVVCL